MNKMTLIKHGENRALFEVYWGIYIVEGSKKGGDSNEERVEVWSNAGD